MDINDIDIIVMVLNGEINKFSILIDKYKNKIFKIVSMHVPSEYVEEVANDIFFKGYKSLKTFKNDSSFINWLTVIAIRTCKDFWRQKYAQKDMPLSSFDEETEKSIEFGVDNVTPEDNILNNEKYKILMKAMDKIKPVERTIISMLYAEERSISEIASITGLTETNVKVIAFRTKKKLSEILNDML